VWVHQIGAKYWSFKRHDKQKKKSATRWVLAFIAFILFAIDWLITLIGPCEDMIPQCLMFSVFSSWVGRQKLLTQQGESMVKFTQKVM
jgi:fatty acid desaturase